MKCLSLFSGAGGLDIGLEAAGFEIVGSVERDTDCCDTLRLNHSWPVIECDVAEIDPTAICTTNSLDLVAGGPPCQPFSKSAQWTNHGARGLADVRSNTLTQFMNIVGHLRPRAFLLENVEGFATAGGLGFIQQKLKDLENQGISYSLSWKILNAAEFGVPQKRKRFVAVGLRDRPDFKFPDPTHGLDRRPYLTAWDACASALDGEVLENLKVKGRWADLLPSIPEGKNYLWHTSRGGGLPLFGWRTRYWSFLKKLHPCEPSPTIVASPSQNSGPFHWENRLLSTNELAAIQTFPKNYRFSGDRSSRQRQIGNAVPPVLAATLGRAILHQLGSCVSKSHSLGVLPAETVYWVPEPQQVPPRYHNLKGIHADHAGPGKGPKPRKTAMQQSAIAP